MAIIDNRTLVTAADATTNFVNLAGAAAGNANSETFIEGSGSVSQKISQASDGLLYNFGSPQDFSNNTFYIWINVSTAGKLAIKSSGGITMRFCGATISDWFEVDLAGVDTYSGGFFMAAVNIEEARTIAIAGVDGLTNGTTPATNAIQYVGIQFNIATMISGNIDNCFVDAIWRLPANTPGIILTGNNASVPYTFSDIVTAADAGDTTKAWGTAFLRDGVIFMNTPVRFGETGTPTAGSELDFVSIGELVGWEDQIVPTGDFYSFDIIGDGSTTANFVVGSKVGTGDDAVGLQGGVITAPSNGPRFSISANNSNINNCQFLGTTLIHVDKFYIDNDLTEIRSCLLTDIRSITGSSVANGTAVFQKNTALDANTLDDASLFITDDLAVLKNNSFVFSDGHAIEINSAGTYSFDGNTFTNYGANDTTDAAIKNTSGGQVTINVSNANSPTVTSTSNTTVQLVTNFTINNIIDDTEIRIHRTSDGLLIGGIETVGFAGDGQSILNPSASGSTNGTYGDVQVDDYINPSGEQRRQFTFSYNSASSFYNPGTGLDVQVKVYNINYIYQRFAFTLADSAQTQSISQQIDRNYLNPT